MANEQAQSDAPSPSGEETNDGLPHEDWVLEWWGPNGGAGQFDEATVIISESRYRYLCQIVDAYSRATKETLRLRELTAELYSLLGKALAPTLHRRDGASAPQRPVAEGPAQ
jgi:hypothetical protein